jgi:hypothetical protein
MYNKVDLCMAILCYKIDNTIHKVTKQKYQTTVHPNITMVISAAAKLPNEAILLLASLNGP